MNIWLFVTMALVGCVDPVPLTSIHHEQVIAIEGYITSDFMPQQIKISTTSPLGTRRFVPVNEAAVTIQDQVGNTYPAYESSPGVYLTTPFAGTVGRSYSLHITTKGGETYKSDEVVLKDVPNIGSIYAIYPSPEPYASDGIQIYVDSPDPAHLTSFYRWEYEYTYEIQTPLISRLEWLGGNSVNVRSMPVDRCWPSDTSRNILIQDNSHLAQSGVKAFPIKFIPADGRDLAVKCSILVRQYPLDEVMYRYWNQIRKVNETQGTLFDIQPGPVQGNVRSTSNPDETVLGFFDAGVVKTKRAFFVPHDFAKAGFIPVDYFGVCNSINPAFVAFDKIGAYMSVSSATTAIVTAGVDQNGPYYVVWPKTCTDCTREGPNIMPDFWQ
jgi:hypothetical protein